MPRIFPLLVLLLISSYCFAQPKQGQAVSGDDTSMVKLLTLKKIGTHFLDQAQDSTLPVNRSERLALADSAIFYFQQFLTKLPKDQLDQYQDAKREVSEAYVLKGAYKEAVDAYEEHINYRDSFNNREYAKKQLLVEMKIEAQKAQDSVRAEGERKALALRRDAALAALRYEYEQKKALARTDAERSKFKYEEELKRRQIEEEYNYTTTYLEHERQREADSVKSEADKRAGLAATELKRRNILIWGILGGSVLLLVGVVVALIAYRGKHKAAVIIAGEQARNQGLLYNILPEQVAEELKATGSSEARQYEDVSVLITDFVNFSAATESRSPRELVQELHECFSAFDHIIAYHGLEKIKTIGDAYLAVCGLPHSNSRHAHATVAAALEIRDYLALREQEHHSFKVRIGIHSGPVVAGIVGKMKYGYDVWGDTVNITARMEREGTPGIVTISEATYKLVRHEFPCISRGRETESGLQMYRAEAPL